MTYAFDTARLPAMPLGTAPPGRFEAGLPDLVRVLAERREEFMAARQIAPDVIERLKALGLYRAMVARRFGGDERSPAEFCRMIEAIAEADGSAGWVASFGVSATYLAALPEPTLETLYADGPDIVFAGGLFPLQPARKVEGGFVVNGRWKFGSGATGATHIGVGITVEGDTTGGLPRVAVMPAAQVEIVPDWDVVGLQGTGSHDLVVRDVFVPEDWTLIRGGAPSVDAAVYRYPTMAFAAQVLAVVGLGIARSALSEVAAMAGGRASLTGAPRMADRAHVQIEVAKAEAALRSARAFFYEATEAAWQTVLAGDRPSNEAVATLRLAATHAARTGADESRAAFALAGTTAIYNGHRLSRALCDSLVVAQHAFLGEGTLMSAGRVLLGLPTTPGFP
ncbi:acyl-CoA dehydrogenase family protein [Methylobacterium terricola]|nr:acyl-CoA dehydrogenase family protein [Methylobacterium terricola]